MKVDYKLIMVAALIGVVIALMLFRNGCGSRNIQGVDVVINYDSIERVIKSQLPPADTVFVQGETITKWLPSAKVTDTIYLEGKEIPVYMVGQVDTNAILTHYLTQAVTYVDTIRDSALQAVISDVIFRNQIKERVFQYKILRPIEIQNIDNRDKFQLIASFQAGGGISYANTPQSIYAGIDLGLKFKNGTYFSVGYMAGTSHFVTLRAGQVIRLKKPKLRRLL